MEKIKSIIEISELIAREISGDLSQSEKESLKEWLNCSQRNKRIYIQIIKGNNLSERNLINKSINTHKGWENVTEALNIHHKKQVIRLAMKYAAAILLPIVFGITAYRYLNNQPQEIPVSLVQIQPGSSNAVLVLANGKSVNLSEYRTQALVEADGTVIKNTKDELSYDGNDVKGSRKELFNTLIVPRGGEYNLVLSDGSRVYVNSMSKLVYPVKFSGNIREITLVEGEAYFEVAKDKSKPFVVNVKEIKVEVLGTSFNIKAYADDNHFYTTLVEGKVKLSAENQVKNAYFLEPDQQAVCDSEAAGVIIQKVDASQIIQWISGKYSFTNQSLDEIMKTLSRWYDFEYRYGDETLKQIRFEGGLNKYESITPIIEIISKTGKVNVEIKGKEILFTKI
jgi:ferric-dicitrate binding protein FerR (iron transport regulator)